MNLQDALYLAGVIDASDKAMLIAVGRFLPAGEITADSPWGCSVRMPDGRSQTVWSMYEWVQLCNPKPEEDRLKPTLQREEDRLKPALQQDKRRDAKHRQQLSLF